MRNIIGQTFGRLTVLHELPERSNHHIVWQCRCACGVEVAKVSSELLRVRAEHSCGCLRRGIKCRFKSTYNSWRAARSRCCDKSNSRYRIYGGRGITMCDRWRDSCETFLADMGPRPAGTTLDRFPNNDGNYEPGNCRWATLKQQARNKSTSAFLTVGGHTKTLAEWTELQKLGSTTIRDRLAAGWPLEDAVLKPKALGGNV